MEIQTESDYSNLALSLNQLAYEIYRNSLLKGFWEEESVPTKLALIHAEVSEALEVDRAGGDEEEFVEELADVIIRVLDLTGYFGYDIGQVIVDKHRKNQERPYKHNKRY